jgi:hypothetical protein
MSAGFYKLEGDTLHHGPNYVRCLEYKLFKEQKDGYEYPVDGWYWFDGEGQARQFWGLTPADEVEGNDVL